MRRRRSHQFNVVIPSRACRQTPTAKQAVDNHMAVFPAVEFQLHAGPVVRPHHRVGFKLMDMQIENRALCRTNRGHAFGLHPTA